MTTQFICFEVPQTFVSVQWTIDDVLSPLLFVFHQTLFRVGIVARLLITTIFSKENVRFFKKNLSMTIPSKLVFNLLWIYLPENVVQLYKNSIISLKLEILKTYHRTIRWNYEKLILPMKIDWISFSVPPFLWGWIFNPGNEDLACTVVLISETEGRKCWHLRFKTISQFDSQRFTVFMRLSRSKMKINWPHKELASKLTFVYVTCVHSGSSTQHLINHTLGLMSAATGLGHEYLD